MDLDSLIKSVEQTVNKLPLPRFDLPSWLVYCTSMKRTGISVGRAIANVYSWMNSAGIPTGPNYDGTPNLVAGTASAIVKSVLDEISDNAYIQGSSAPGDIMVQATGGNAGGPVTVVGQNINFSKIVGLLR